MVLALIVVAIDSYRTLFWFISMRPLLGWPIALIFAFLAIGAHLNGDLVNDWVQKHSITVNEEEIGPIVGAQENENWFVVLIDFPDQAESNNCNQQRASTLIDSSAENYFKQGVFPNGSIEITYHERIVTTKYGMADYGHDENGENDVGRNGVNPHTLAEEVVEEISSEVDWEKFDLNDDGWVDRFLILHCIKPQEDGSGSPSRIWSHFSTIENIVELDDNMRIAYYTIASQYNSNNFGTIIHEMYHQFGAADLYPVHSSTVTQTWKGVGKWDIMASGNWNGDGAWPALPTSATTELIGGERHHDVVLDWAGTSSCTGPNVILTGLAEGGNSLKIPIADEEFIWIEYRSDYGFDSRLPGNGILVLQQDLKAGSVEDNLVNSHPDRPWLKVIEADGDNGLLSGADEGEESDLFWDGDKFGSEGIEIRNRDGVLVDWVANISVNSSEVMVKFSSDECGHQSTFDFPDYTSVLTPDAGIDFTGKCSGEEFQLTSSDGRGIIVNENKIKFDTSGIVGVVGIISGTIECDTGTAIDLRHEFEILGNIPIESAYESKIPYDRNSVIQVPIDTIGGGQQSWIVGIEGALARIASTSQSQTLGPKSYIEITINHNELLSEGMLVRGELILATDSGQRYTISIELTASNQKTSTIDNLTEPSTLVPIALLLVSLWVVLGIDSPSREVSSELDEIPLGGFESDDPVFIDPFGESY